MLTYFALEPETLSPESFDKVWEHKNYLNKIVTFWRRHGALYHSKESLRKFEEYIGRYTVLAEFKELCMTGLIRETSQNWDGHLPGPTENIALEGLEIATANESWRQRHEATMPHIALTDSEMERDVPLTKNLKYTFIRDASFSSWSKLKEREDLKNLVLNQTGSCLESAWDERIMPYVAAKTRKAEESKQIVIYDIYALQHLYAEFDSKHRTTHGITNSPITFLARKISESATESKVLTVISGIKNLYTNPTTKKSSDATPEDFNDLCDYLWKSIQRNGANKNVKIERLIVYGIDSSGRGPASRHDRHLRVGCRHVFTLGPGIEALAPAAYRDCGDGSPSLRTRSDFSLKTQDQVRPYRDKEQEAIDSVKSGEFKFKVHLEK